MNVPMTMSDCPSYFHSSYGAMYLSMKYLSQLLFYVYLYEHVIKVCLCH